MSFSLLALVSCRIGPAAPTRPWAVILFIGDGMGPEQVRAAELYAHGRANTLPFRSFPGFAWVTTGSADQAITDSAAAATAMATGNKVPNGAISMLAGTELPTVLELYGAEGLSTGLVTTTHITHATPAAFGAHAESRDQYEDIASDYLLRSRPTVLLGGGGMGASPEQAQAGGYSVPRARAELEALQPSPELRVWGQFGEGHMPYVLDGLGDLPSLAQMTDAALRILEQDPEGFFLLVEGGRIDHACHENDILRSIGETLAFADAVAVAARWCESRPDVLLAVTADHETGGLEVLEETEAGILPPVSWETTGHTAVNVGLWAMGPGSGELPELLDNTEIYGLLRGEPAWRRKAAIRELSVGAAVPGAGADA